jgi:hypothetical protein
LNKNQKIALGIVGLGSGIFAIFAFYKGKQYFIDISDKLKEGIGGLGGSDTGNTGNTGGGNTGGNTTINNSGIVANIQIYTGANPGSGSSKQINNWKCDANLDFGIQNQQKNTVYIISNDAFQKWLSKWFNSADILNILNSANTYLYDNSGSTFVYQYIQGVYATELYFK